MKEQKPEVSEQTSPKSNLSGTEISAERSRNMRAVRSGDTKPEITVRKLLHRLGYRFRLRQANLPGKPDIVLPRHKLVVFVHGCFWHRHNCKRATIPKTRTDFWETKLSANAARDARVLEALQELGWRSVVIWECETRDHDLIAARIAAALTS